MDTFSTFYFWCQKVLPLVYDDSLSYYEVLCKVVDYIKKLIEQDKIFVDQIYDLKREMAAVLAWVDRVNAGYIGEKIIFIGDSYGTDARTTPWTDTFVELAGLGETDYINSCEGGVGWTEKENNHNFLTKLQAAYNVMLTAPYNWTASEVTKIIVAGGAFRDITVAEYDYDTLEALIENRIQAFMSYAKSTFPNAKIYYAYCNDCINYGVVGNSGAYWQELLNNSFNYYYNASKYGYIFLPNIRYVLMHNYRINTQENTMMHPNGLGGVALGTAIHNAVYGSWFDVIRGSVNVNTGSDNSSLNCRMRLIAENGDAKLVFRDAANITIDSRAGQIYELCALPDNLQYRDAVNSFTDVRGVAFAQARDSENHVTLIPVDIVGNNLSLNAQIIGAYGKYTSVTISPFTIICERDRIFQNYHA